MKRARLTPSDDIMLARRLDADALFAERRYTGSVYMAGYAVERILKAAICRRRGETYLPREDETHDLTLLLYRSGLGAALAGSDVGRAFDDLASRWTTSLRYTGSRGRASEARKMVEGAADVAAWVQRQMFR